jgi:hypothetical protein
MAKLKCKVCGHEEPVPHTGGLTPMPGMSGAAHGEAIPDPEDPSILRCRCGDPDHDVPMPKHCGKYMEYIPDEE